MNFGARRQQDACSVSKDTSLRFPDPRSLSWDKSCQLSVERVLMKNTNDAADRHSRPFSAERKTGAVRVDLHRGPF